MATKTKINAVFEGGGVKGTGLVGAVAATMAAGFEFGNVAGTSAGAIVASLIAAGYTAEQLRTILDDVNYNNFKDAKGFSRLPVLGPAINLFVQKGIYAGDYFENWIRDLLAQKGVKTFGDLVLEEYKNDPRYRFRLQVIASDITRGKLLVLPKDAADYGIKPDELDVAWAIRMSMSLPYFYEPAVLKTVPSVFPKASAAAEALADKLAEDPLNNLKAGQKNYIVDGGILSNYPVWILDDEKNQSSWPTFGYKLVEPDENRPHNIYGPITFFAAMFGTMLEAHDQRYITDANFLRTIPIPTLGVRTTDFNITKGQKDSLFNSGLAAGQNFFKAWDFEWYKKNMKMMKTTSRAQRLAGKQSF